MAKAHLFFCRGWKHSVLSRISSWSLDVPAPEASYIRFPPARTAPARVSPALGNASQILQRKIWRPLLVTWHRGWGWGTHHSPVQEKVVGRQGRHTAHQQLYKTVPTGITGFSISLILASREGLTNAGRFGFTVASSVLHVRSSLHFELWMCQPLTVTYSWLLGPSSCGTLLWQCEQTDAGLQGLTAEAQGPSQRPVETVKCKK